MQSLQKLQDIRQILDLNPDLKDPQTESTFEALVRFNSDMR